MTRLSVNINKVATLRNARGGGMPDVIRFAQDCERFGAEGITVHPRPDERHITREDVFALSKIVTTEFNIEGYPDQRYLDIVRLVKPVQATLVPDSPEVLTSNAGWNTIENKSFLSEIMEEINSYGVRTSLFVDPDPKMIETAATCGADRIELYTESFASNYSISPEEAVKPYVISAETAHGCNLGINAGHDLNLQNLTFFKESVHSLNEVSIGHALICDALYLGIENTIQMYKRCLR